MDIDLDGPRLADRDKDPDTMDTSLDLKHVVEATGKGSDQAVGPEVLALQDERQIFEQPRQEDALPKPSNQIGKILTWVSVAH